MVRIMWTVWSMLQLVRSVKVRTSAAVLSQVFGVVD